MLVEREQTSDRLQSAIVCAASLISASLVGVWLTWPSWGGGFGAIDDHEPLGWIGPDGRLGWTSAWSTWWGIDEVGDWNAHGRYRPAYYAVRVGQAVAFGDNANLWYASVLVMFIATCALIGVAAARWLTVVVAVSAGACAACASGVAVLVASLPAWRGILGRLGPSEQLGLLAVAVVILSASWLLTGSGDGWWLPTLGATFVAVLSKETFVTVATLSPIVAWHRANVGMAIRRQWVCAAAAFVPVVWLAVVLPHRLRSGDVYGRAVGRGRLGGAWAALSGPFGRPWLMAGVVLLLIAAAAITTDVVNLRRQSGRTFVALVVFLMAVVPADGFLNAGEYTLPRYSAVVELVTLVLVLMAAVIAVRLPRRSAVAVAATSLVVLSVLGVLVDIPENVTTTRRNVGVNAQNAGAYRAGINEATRRLDANPTLQPVVVVPTEWAYEPAMATAIEVWRHTGEPSYLSPSVDASSLLGGRLHLFSADGNDLWHVGRLSGLKPESVLCLVIGGGEAENVRCDDVVAIHLYGM